MHTKEIGSPMKALQTYLKPFFAAMLLLLAGGFVYNVNAQNGYIYIQKKALDETSSIDFPFTVSGGPTIVPNFSLNDQEAQVPLQDIGASQGGRLWAVDINNILYYRDLGSSTWVATIVTDAYRVDGGPGNTCYYLSSTSYAPYSFNGVTRTLLGNLADFAANSGYDIGSAWDTKPYVVRYDGTLWQYSGIGTTWLQVGTSSDNNFVDGNPANGNAIVTKNDNTISSITSAGVATTLGSPNGIDYVEDIAVTADGSIFGGFDVDSLASNDYAFKWISGTDWSSYEITSRNYAESLTGGLGGQVWGLNNNGDVNSNIFTRTYDGTNSLWLNDERVRTLVKGNSEMIAVAPGTYTITELVPAGWDLQHINAYDPTNNSSTSVVANTATVSVSAGETVTAVFENGLVIPFLMTNSCAVPYIETFGTGAVGTYGTPLIGQTSYHYQTTGNTLADDYKIVGNANMLYGGSANLTDHTAGDGQGRMMAIDANNEQDAFFRRRFIGIIPGATYTFSAWIANIDAGDPIMPNVTFDVIDPTTYAVLQTLNTGDITSDAVWTKYGITFTATVTAFDLVIRNNGYGGSGNDLAIDDIFFSMAPVPAPVTTVVNTGCDTLGSIMVTYPLGSNYEYSIDSFATPAHSSTIFNNLPAGNYTTSVRFVGTVDCFTSKTDLVGATICGNIWDDANGDAINNNEKPITSGVWINLVNPSTNAVLQSMQVDSSGNYNLTGLPINTNYQIILSNANQTGNTNLTTASLPSRYVVTGTNLNGTVSTTDTTGVININTGSGGGMLQNIGIEKLPNTYAKMQLLTHPTGAAIPAGTITTPVSGTDAEDGTLTNSSKITITNLPANATMFYNGIAVTASQQITGFNPSLVSFTGIAPGSTSVVFSYAFLDAAGKQDPTPASYTLNWLGTLAISLESFTGIANDCNSVTLQWKVNNAVNFSSFEIESSTNGIDFKTQGVIIYDLSINDYQFSENSLNKGSYQYRLKMVDDDGKTTYSPVVFINLDCAKQNKLLIYPNPSKNKITITGLNAAEQITVFDATGQLIKSTNAAGYQLNIDLTNLASGTYFIIITNKSGEKISESKIVKID